MGKGSGELSALSLLNFWLALVAAWTVKTAAPWVRGERSAGQMPVTRSVCALGWLSAARPMCAGENPSCRTRARVRQPLLAIAPAVRIARRNWVLLFPCLSSTKTLQMGSAGEGSLVAACCGDGQRRRCFGFLKCIVLACAMHVCGTEACPDHSCLAVFSCGFSFLNAKTDIILHKNSFTSVVQYKLRCKLFGTFESHTVRRADCSPGGLHELKNTLT